MSFITKLLRRQEPLSFEEFVRKVLEEPSPPQRRRRPRVFKARNIVIPEWLIVIEVSRRDFWRLVEILGLEPVFATDDLLFTFDSNHAALIARNEKGRRKGCEGRAPAVEG